MLYKKTCANKPKSRLYIILLCCAIRGMLTLISYLKKFSFRKLYAIWNSGKFKTLKQKAFVFLFIERWQWCREDVDKNKVINIKQIGMLSHSCPTKRNISIIGIFIPNRKIILNASHWLSIIISFPKLLQEFSHIFNWFVSAQPHRQKVHNSPIT